MAPGNSLLPTRDQCLALTDEQCHQILEHRDPQGSRANKDWELQHQPQLVRLYMTMLSFPDIKKAMRSKLDWSYKTYANRYKEWCLPADRLEREQVVLELFSLVSGSNTSSPAEHTLPPESINLPIRPQPIPHQAQPYVVPPDFFVSVPAQRSEHRDHVADRMSVSTTGTFASGSSHSAYNFDETLSNPRFSIATTNSSMSAGSQYSFQPSRAPQPSTPLHSQAQRRPLRAPKHDSQAGLWNDVLRVIPCGKNHSRIMWQDESFAGCPICGFTRWHALMLHARSIPVDVVVAAMQILRHITRVDFAGNHPIHFLMAAGVGIEYFTHEIQSGSCTQNSFGQNPLHVLNPQDLGEQVISFLEWFMVRERPPGILLTQRDIFCRTPLHAILQHPLERSMYQRIIKVFPYAEHQLRSLDTSGRGVTKMMNKASLKLKDNSLDDYDKIQAGITETNAFLSESGGNQTASSYGFRDIARGARGTSYPGWGFRCRICNIIDAHSNSYVEQMICACNGGRDRNGPDEVGMTPAHALILHERCNNDSSQTPETASQTADLFRVLIPANDPTLREALHVLDPEGNSLVYNIATRGFDEILSYVLEIEDPSRWRAMVNTCSKGHQSVLDAVHTKIQDVRTNLRATLYTENVNLRSILVDKEHRLVRCKRILVAYGAVPKPDNTTRWKIC